MNINRIKSFILYGDIDAVIFFPGLIGFLIMLLLIFIVRWLDPNAPVNWGFGIGFPIFLWFSGLGGIVQIIRKETYGALLPYKGIRAVFSGVVMVVACWVASILILYHWIIEPF